MKVALINALEKGSKYTDNLGIGCIASFLREHKIDVDIHYAVSYTRLTLPTICSV